MLIPVVYRHRQFSDVWYGFLDEPAGRAAARHSPEAAETDLKNGTLDFKSLGQFDPWSWTMTRLERVE